MAQTKKPLSLALGTPVLSAGAATKFSGFRFEIDATDINP
jgi:hypothetical protein